MTQEILVTYRSGVSAAIRLQVLEIRLHEGMEASIRARSKCSCSTTRSRTSSKNVSPEAGLMLLLALSDSEEGVSR